MWPCTVPSVPRHSPSNALLHWWLGTLKGALTGVPVFSQVANQLVNLVAGHAKRLDTDLEEFAAELSAAGEDPNDMLAGGLPSPYPTAGSPFPLMSQPSGGSSACLSLPWPRPPCPTSVALKGEPLARLPKLSLAYTPPRKASFGSLVFDTVAHSAPFFGSSVRAGKVRARIHLTLWAMLLAILATRGSGAVTGDVQRLSIRVG